MLTIHSFGHMTYGSLCCAGCLGSDDIVSCKVAAKGAGEGPCAREGEHDEWWVGKREGVLREERVLTGISSKELRIEPKWSTE